MKLNQLKRVNPFAKDQGMFSPFAIEQQLNHCGPCSLSSCLFMLGIEANQRELAWAAGVPFKIYRQNKGGTGPQQLKEAMEQYGVTAKDLSEGKSNGDIFLENLIGHLSETGPALLSIDDGYHWIAAVGYFPDKAKPFAIYDPNKTKPFYLWSPKHLLSQCWNVDDDGVFDYPAILLRRKDGQKPVWWITEEWVKIHNRGSDCTAGTIASDLRDLVNNAYSEVHQSAVLSDSADSASESIRLSAFLETYRRQVLDAILYWQEGSNELTKKDLKDLYSDYVTCADACRLHISKNADHATFVAGLTALFSAYWWGAEMG